MASVYGDISGDESGVMVGACYLGHDFEWTAAEATWRRHLKAAGVSAFHATDFYSANGEFSGPDWTIERDGRRIPGGSKHTEFAQKFTAVADDAGLLGTAYGMHVEPFMRIVVPAIRLERRRCTAAHPRLWVVFKSLARVDDFLARTEYRERGKIPVVFENEQGAGRFKDFFAESLERNEHWAYWFRSFDTEGKESVRLQIADLLAHEGWRRAKEILADKPRDLRKSFRRMMMRERVELQWQGEEHCPDMARLIRETLKKFPNGLTGPHGLP